MHASGAPPGTPAGHAGVVHIAEQHAYRRRGVRPAARLPDHLGQLPEEVGEGRPMFQVGALAQLLAEARPAPLGPAALATAQRGVPLLRVVDERRQEPRQRSADQEMVVRTGVGKGFLAPQRASSASSTDRRCSSSSRAARVSTISSRTRPKTRR